ncbi:MAG TPA: hydantoinase/oxoprolinase family protein [Candidatus Acetothermia bacterium]|nr:hydantoinase/oxoprolinase family protein [Candidatus Acetothermia bacterium]
MGIDDLITLDMGGTSCDVALIYHGMMTQTTSGSVGGHPVAIRMNDIHTIGAGGGSIAWVDSGGALRVGPRSAGAMPGPACYGHGGELATVSDAHVVLGHLRPEWPLGGTTRVDVHAAFAAMERLAKRLRLSVERTAIGVLRVADASMERAVRLISVERGYDPRDFAMVAFGGAGPLHAASIAARLSIPRVIVPAVAGVLSAAGLLGCMTGREYGQSVVRRISRLTVADVASFLEGLLSRGYREVAEDELDEANVSVEISADLRYFGQSHELNVMCPDASGRLSEATLIAWKDAFHREHRNRFGHASEEEVEMVALRVRMTGPASFQYSDLTRDRDEALRHSQWADVWFGPDGPQKTLIADRRRSREGDRVQGPAVLWAPDSTLLVPPGLTAACDGLGTMILEVVP